MPEITHPRNPPPESERHNHLLDAPEGIAALGFFPIIDRSSQSPIITDFPFPLDPNFDFDLFYHKLAERDLIIYPGKLAHLDCFRIGSIGHITRTEMCELVAAIETVLQEMNVRLPVKLA